MSSLVDLEVLIVDCQATGASPAHGSVLELGWGVVRGRERALQGAQAHWIALPEGHSVPKQVQKLTGYDPKLVRDPLIGSDAWQRLRSAASRGARIPTVIHYARFELAFLRDWSARFEPRAEFPLDVVCVHQIASRLYPELPRRSLRALAGYLGYSLHLERRSLGHVQATAFVWQRLLVELEARGIGTWDALLAWLAERPAPRSRAKKSKYPIDRQRYLSLPNEPGVYHFLRSNGDVLYVGKATSLKKRVASHFTGRAKKALAPEMLTQVNDIRVTVTASALEAALLENETIKSLAPPYNVQLTSLGQPAWYSSHDFTSTKPRPDEWHRIGPLASQFSLTSLGALIALVEGKNQSGELLARAVGISALGPPDEEVFRSAWGEIVAHHASHLEHTARAPRLRVLALARSLLLAGRVVGNAEGSDDTAEDEEDETDAAIWDPARVVEHVENCAAQAFRAYRRARWLSLLHDCDVVYREPTAKQARLLQLRGGALAAATASSFYHAPGSRLGPNRRPPTVDRRAFDRLRVLNTELKRIARDGGEVVVYWGPGRVLQGRFAPRVLGLV